MAEFYLIDVSTDERQRCQDSIANRWPVTVEGRVADGGVVRSFHGVVQAIDDMGANAPEDRRWRVTMLEQTSGATPNRV